MLNEMIIASVASISDSFSCFISILAIYGVELDSKRNENYASSKDKMMKKIK